MDAFPRTADARGTSRFDQTRHIGQKPVTLTALGETLSRRWKLLVAVIILTTGGAFVAALLITPKYDAISRIRITPARQSPLDYEDATKNGPLDQASLNTEIATIESRDVARRVVRVLNLQGDPEFVGVAKPSLRLSPELAQARAIEVATSALMARVSVEQQDKSLVLTIKVRTLNALKSANIANAVAAAYIDNTADVQMSTAARQSSTGQEALQRLGADVQAKEAEVAEYRARVGIVQGGANGTINEQQIGPLSMQLATAESQAAAARSQVLAAQRQMSSGGTDAISAVLSSSVIADLRRQRTEAESRRAELNARYGPKHPDVIQSNQKIEALDRQIRQEQKRIVDGLRSAADAADAQAASLRSQLAVLKGTIGSNNQASVKAEALQREAEAARAAYTRLATSVQQSSQAQRSNEPQARVLERAVVMSQPSYPNRPAMVAAGLLVGLVLGFAIVLIVDGVQATVRKPEDVETMLDVKFITAVQQLTRRQRKDRDGKTCSPAGTLSAKPVSAYSEAFRTIRNAVRSSRTTDRKIIAISSTLPAEGKTTSALSLARVMALSGERVLLIDCDIRRSSILRETGVETAIGLIEVLSGDGTFDQAIGADMIPELDVMPVLKPTFTPIDVFNSDAMRNLLSTLRTKYDYIILDTPPLLGVADARTLALLADTVVLTVKWNSTPIPAIDAALAGLEQDGASVLGVVLTMVDSRSEAMGALYYSSRYSSYYEQ
ncbi:GumC family protein [Sphingomonas sp. PL20]|uniref:GumC family protein n=1 Tax=Sphingomonas sp. PL20 TaxID=2760712 RepID=UPI001AE2BA79